MGRRSKGCELSKSRTQNPRSNWLGREGGSGQTSEVELALLDGVEEVRALPYQVGGEPNHGGWEKAAAMAAAAGCWEIRGRGRWGRESARPR